MSIALRTEIPVHRLSSREWRAMAEAGVFGDEKRIELLDGLPTQPMTIGERHQIATDILNRVIVRCAPDHLMVRVQGPISLEEGWVPQPDLTVYDPAAPKPYHPQRGELLIEIADSSLRLDRTIKRPAYARNGVPELWIVNVADLVVEVHRGPRGDTYGECLEARGGELRCAAIPAIAVDLDGLFAAVAAAPRQAPSGA